MTDIEEYERRFVGHLQEIACNLESLVREQVGDIGLVDRISARAKSPDRFAAKAAKNNEDGSPKYSAPLTEIQDQIGVRVVVFYLDVVTQVSEAALRYHRSIENNALVPETPWEFGYFGQHHVLALPNDAIPVAVDPSQVPRFFELQIKTLFQHAWSEAEHDLGYKPPVPLNNDQERLMAFAAAQAWGADEAFARLRQQLLN